MTTRDGQPALEKSTWARWRPRLIGVLALIVVLVVAYFILAAFLPRWWAQRIASLVGGSFAKGIGWGLFFGGLLTLASLLLLLLAVTMWRRKGGKFVAGASVILALLLAVPNLLTLTIVLGGSNAAHAGERILDVDGPAFRGAGITGAIIALVLFLGAVGLTLTRWWRRRGTRGSGVQDTATDTTTGRHRNA
ncbi:permease [Nocardia callitridis]|uniref:Permease n=1 Tax=Nocardia callitridis TaxID=648753 RepID=A0ABP9KKS9_9NOCA